MTPQHLGIYRGSELVRIASSYEHGIRLVSGKPLAFYHDGLWFSGGTWSENKPVYVSKPTPDPEWLGAVEEEEDWVVKALKKKPLKAVKPVVTKLDEGKPPRIIRSVERKRSSTTHYRADVRMRLPGAKKDIRAVYRTSKESDIESNLARAERALVLFQDAWNRRHELPIDTTASSLGITKGKTVSGQAPRIYKGKKGMSVHVVYMRIPGKPITRKYCRDMERAQLILAEFWKLWNEAHSIEGPQEEAA